MAGRTKSPGLDTEARRAGQRLAAPLFRHAAAQTRAKTGAKMTSKMTTKNRLGVAMSC